MQQIWSFPAQLIWSKSIFRKAGNDLRGEIHFPHWTYLPISISNPSRSFKTVLRPLTLWHLLIKNETWIPNPWKAIRHVIQQARVWAIAVDPVRDNSLLSQTAFFKSKLGSLRCQNFERRHKNYLYTDPLRLAIWRLFIVGVFFPYWLFLVITF